jgi:hypothetical protein
LAISADWALAWIVTLGSVHWAEISACALQLALHFASALGAFTSAWQCGAFQVPSHFVWQVASQWPWQVPLQ